MNTPENANITIPMAPIVLKTLAIPTAEIQAGIANTKMVLKVFRTDVRAVRASPMISDESQHQASHSTLKVLTIVRIKHVCQSQTLQRRRAEIADAQSYSHLWPRPAIVQGVAEPPCAGKLKWDEREEDPETHLWFVDAVVALRQSQNSVV